jgi:hypothetical protein
MNPSPKAPPFRCHRSPDSIYPPFDRILHASPTMPKMPWGWLFLWSVIGWIGLVGVVALIVAASMGRAP